LVHEFYENLFSSEHCDSIDPVLHAIPSKVTTEMNADLCKHTRMRRLRLLFFRWDLPRRLGQMGSQLYFIKTIGNFLKKKFVLQLGAFMWR
jgi:hypothetical protein